jgi:hypothetical protein
MTLTWPSTPEQILFWANLALIWMATNYLVPPSPPREGRGPIGLLLVRALVATGGVLVLAGWRAWVPALMLLTVSLLLPLVRPAAAGKRRRAEWEIACNSLFLLGAAVAVSRAGLQSRWAPLVPGLAAGQAAVLALVTAAALFLLRGAAEVVRGILEKAESLPAQLEGQSATSGAQEFNRGRLIGYLERLLIVAIVMASQFGALGVLIAAKGLIRSRELERHEFAEYFLIGTLASITVAFFVGLGLRALVLTLW